MFATFFRFERRFWTRGAMLYVFVLIIALLTFGAVASDNVQIGGTLENTLRNAPHVIQSFYAILSLLTCLMVTAFVNSAASRDFAYNTHQIIFTKPLDKLSYLMGRFWGSTLIAIVPLLGVSLGILVAAFMPWNEPQQWGPVVWGAHLWGIIAFAVPNTILFASFVFAIAIWTRSTMASFVGVILLIVGYAVSGALLSDLENDTLTRLLDPIAARTFTLETKYWTVAEKNTQYLTLTGMLLWNRLLWLGVSALMLGVACWRFSFTERQRRFGRRVREEAPPPAPAALPQVRFTHGSRAAWQQLLSQVRLDASTTVRSTVFIVVMLVATLNCGASLFLSSDEAFGLSSLPVTYRMVDIIRGTLYLFLVGLITFYAGVLVWKEREARLDEVYDALPHPTWITFLAKLISLTLIVGIILCLAIGTGLAAQTSLGYTRYQIGLYVRELLVLDFLQMFCLIVLALFSHVVSPNKYIGYFLFIILLIGNAFAWNVFDVQSQMVDFGTLPSYTYSDMYGFAPYVSALAWFSVYWLLFATLLCLASILVWQRGRETGPIRRIRAAGARWRGNLRWVSVATLALWTGTAGWVFYNTHIVNTYRTGDENTALQARYEKDFKEAHEKKPQPRVTEVKYDIEIFPEQRGLTLHGVETIRNQHEEPISEIFIATADGFDTTVEIERASLLETFADLNYRIYKVDPPMAPGETLQMTYDVAYEAEGFENSVSRVQIVQNGTFFNNGICPKIGYQASREISDKNDRREHGLGEPAVMPELDPHDLEARLNTYISNSSDWVDVETVISTTPDQIAVAPGSLVREWEEDGRRHFHYKVDHPSLNFYSFISARYEVERDKWNDVDVEVYYHPEHKWNVPRMVASIKDSLEYYSESFGPYRHKQARIIEFPRVASFAQAFPGTMPYSEGIGFIADIKEVDDIDMVYYVVAHEMAHQWWAHQVIGANMQGATLLSETLAQYSALMVMERAYGRNMMRRFLRYEMDNYLRSRGRELLKERPLMRVDANQGYIHYRKGSVVMYQLKEILGEEKLNLALRNIVDRFAYQEPPYPTSVDLINAIREQMPPEDYFLLSDLFEHITLYANRAVDATWAKRPDGRYDVTLEVECSKFQADDQGKETELPFQETIEIGAFAAPDKGRRYGETLYRERVPMSNGRSTHRFVVDREPEFVGIDPFALLIDRVPGDNLKRATETEPDAS